MYNCKDYTLTALRAIHKERIIRTLKGLLLSLLLHLMILWLLMNKPLDITFLPPPAQEKKISLDLQQIVTPPEPKPVAKTLPQPNFIPSEAIVEKKIVPLKRKVLDERKKVFAQKSTEEHNQTKPQEKVQKKPIKEVLEKKPTEKILKQIKKERLVKTKTVRKPIRSNDPLANALMGSGTSLYPSKPKNRPSSSGSYGARMINKLYGEEFHTYTQTQKKFIQNNLGTIHKITQNTLTRNGYPEVAIRTRQQGTNIVSFYLHPNGDMSDLKLKRPIGHQALDQNTLEVIRTAYKEYPLPNKKTKIIFYVKYSIY